MIRSAFAVVHLGLLGTWLGAMGYSLLVVQPRVARFLAADDDALEEFSTLLGAGNRRPVLAIVATALGTLAALIVVDRPAGLDAAFYAADALALLAAAAVFARVSWALWPRRVFALPEERPAHRAALRRHALALVGLVGAAFVAAGAALT